MSQDGSVFLVSSSKYNFRINSRVKLTLFYRKHLFNFETIIKEIDNNKARIKKPLILITPASRILFRTKIEESEEAFIVIKDNRYRIIDISSKGIAFFSGNKDFEEKEIIRNTGISITGRFKFITDINIRYVKGKYVYGGSFYKIDDLHRQKVLRYLFKKRYPDFDFFRYSNITKIIPQYYNSKYINLEYTDESGPGIIKILKRLNKIKEYNLLTSIIQYSKNNKLISLGCSIRIYNRTYLGTEVTVVPDTLLIPKEKTDVYLILSDAMLNNQYCSYFMFYITEDYAWHKELFHFFSKALNNEKLFAYDEQHCFTVNIKEYVFPEQTEGRFNMKILYKESREFIEFCNKHLSYLENKSYDYKNRGFSELAQIYQLLNLFMDRCIFRISENRETVAYIVAEAYSPTICLKYNLNSCRVYCADLSISTESVILYALPEINAFYNKYNIREYNILFKWYSNKKVVLNKTWIEYKGLIGRAIMNRQGLKLFKEIFLGNFDYYTDYYPLSTSQKMIWLLENYFPGTSIANVSGTLKIFEKININALEKSVNIFIEKNDGMRLRLIFENGNVKQYLEPFKHRKLDLIDLSHIKKKEELYEWEKNITSRPFDLYNSDLFYYAILKISENEYWLYAKVHHIIHDAYSMGLFTGAVGNYYKKILKNKILKNIPANPSYIDYILKEYNYKYTEFFDEDQEYFRNKFNTIPELLSYKIRKDNKDLRSGRKSFVIKGKILKKINTFTQRNNISMFTFLTAVLFIYLFRITGKNDIVLGTSVFNRTRKEMKMTGIFTSYLPFRIHVDSNKSFFDFLNLVKKGWNELLYHRHYPFELIQKDFREKHKVHDRLFDISITYQNADFGLNSITLDYLLKWNPYGQQMESLNIHINDSIKDNKLIISFDYLASLFKIKEIIEMYKQIKNILIDSINDPEKPVSKLELLSVKEKNKILIDFNKTDVKYPDKTFIELFEEQVEKMPENKALVYKNLYSTYYELNTAANQIAHYLLQINLIDNGKFIGIFIKNSIIQVRAQLGILKSGLAFIPLDINNPIRRIKEIIDDAEIKIIISEKSRFQDIKFLIEECKNLKLCLILNSDNLNLHNDEGIDKIKNGTKLLKHCSIDNPNIKIVQDDICYAIYTSGSTGKPKGVILRHGSLINLCFWTLKYYNVTESYNTTRYASFGFDASIAELFPYLIKGCTVYIIEEGKRLDLKFINEYFNKFKITIAFLPTQIAEEFIKTENLSLKKIIVAGEKLNYFKKKRFKIFNNYGPSENTVNSTSFLVNKQYKNIPIGKPISNVKAYILDEYLNPLPCGIKGELYLSGKSLALGYIYNKVLTDIFFINNPFIPGEKMYKTGDLAEWMKDGNILFHGRKDNQIKIRGFRIEKGEIERNIKNHDNVERALVIESDKNSRNSYLIAFIISRKIINERKIKIFLSKKLPDYMIPKDIVFLKEFPVTVNGKTDVKKLLEIYNQEKSNLIVNYKFEPKNELQIKIQKKWKELLGTENISINDNFFECGGDSIKAIQFINSSFINEYNVSVQDLYDFPTIESFSNKIKNRKVEFLNTKEIEKSKNININDIRITGKLKLKNILLTGSTGFLGSHLLNNLAQVNKYNIFCIVRAQTQKEAVQRQKKILSYYFNDKYDDLNKHSINIIQGDISKKNLGLDSKIYQSLVQKIDTVFNSAAMLKFFGNYSEIEKVNVTGTKNIINLCIKAGAKLNHISTLSISGKYLVSQSYKNPVFDENSYNIGQNYSGNIYVKSKYNAENIIYKNNNTGLKYTIFRIGNISERCSDGIFQSNINDNWIHTIIKVLLNLKIIPGNILHINLDFSPVDYCSDFIFKLSQIKESENKVFHIQNAKQITFKKLFDLFKIFDFNIHILKNHTYYEFLHYIKNNKQEHKWALSKLGEDFNYDRIFGESYKVNVKTEITEKYLSLLNLSWPKIDKIYIKKILEHWKNTGFLSGI